MVLKQSLLGLLKEKSFSSVTVKEICERADINRSTFYAHYQDQYELMERIENEIIEDMTEYLNSYNLQVKEDSIRMTERLISYFAEKNEEIEILLNRSDESSFERKVKEVAQQVIMKEWKEYHQMKTAYSSYISEFIISGTVQMMKRWLLRGMRENPREMAELIHALINRGIEDMYIDQRT
jgi:AcrR family transcriptional regulator